MGERAHLKPKNQTKQNKAHTKKALLALTAHELDIKATVI